MNVCNRNTEKQHPWQVMSTSHVYTCKSMEAFPCVNNTKAIMRGFYNYFKKLNKMVCRMYYLGVMHGVICKWCIKFNGGCTYSTTEHTKQMMHVFPAETFQAYSFSLYDNKMYFTSPSLLIVWLGFWICYLLHCHYYCEATAQPHAQEPSPPHSWLTNLTPYHTIIPLCSYLLSYKI